MNAQKPQIFSTLLACGGWILWILSSAPLVFALGATQRTTGAIIVLTIWNWAIIANFMTPVFNRNWTSFVFNLPIWLAQHIAMVLAIAVGFGLTPIFTILLCLFSIAVLAVMQFCAWHMQRHGFKKLQVWRNWSKNSTSKTAEVKGENFVIQKG